MSREHRKAGLDVLARPVPVQQGADCERVAQVVDAGPASPRRRPQPGPADQFDEGHSHHRVVQTFADRRDEKAGIRHCRAKPVADFGVGTKCLKRPRVKWHFPRLAELRLTDPEQPRLPIHVVPVEPNGLAHAEPRHGQEAEEGLVCSSAQPLA